MTVRLRNALWNLILQIINNNGDDALWVITTRHFRLPQHELDELIESQRVDLLWQLVGPLRWYQIYDLLEFVVENSRDLSGGSWSRAAAQGAANAVFTEEVSGYRFIQGVLSPITDKGEIESIEHASATAGTLGLEGVRLHLDAALQLLGKKPKPDYRNSIKESISAVEAVAKKISGEHGGGLDAALKELAKHAEIHKGL